MHLRSLLSIAAVTTITALPACAQGTPAAATPTLRVAASPRASTTLAISTGVRGAAPLTVKVDYGQPFARGRQVEGGLIPRDTVWRTGANAATSFTTDVNLQLGTLMVPKGSYTLYSLWSPARGMQLIINKQTGQWGTEYKADMDLGRVAMTARTLSEASDAFVITLVPTTAPATPPAGVLRMVWGRTEFSVPFTVQP